MASQEKVDRRVRKTRQALRSALAELVVEQEYAAITVQQITHRAGVARTTFYQHFQDKDDLLFNGFRDLYEELQAAVSPTRMNDTADWEHVAAHANFYRAMLGERGNAAFVAFLRELLAGVMREHLLQPLLSESSPPRLDVDLMAHYLAGAQLGLYAWWLDNNLQPSGAEMAQAGQDLAVKGLLWGLGIAGSSMEAPVG